MAMEPSAARAGATCLDVTTLDNVAWDAWVAAGDDPAEAGNRVVLFIERKGGAVAQAACSQRTQLLEMLRNPSHIWYACRARLPVAADDRLREAYVGFHVGDSAKLLVPRAEWVAALRSPCPYWLVAPTGQVLPATQSSAYADYKGKTTALGRDRCQQSDVSDSSRAVWRLTPLGAPDPRARLLVGPPPSHLELPQVMYDAYLNDVAPPAPLPPVSFGAAAAAVPAAAASGTAALQLVWRECGAILELAAYAQRGGDYAKLFTTALNGYGFKPLWDARRRFAVRRVFAARGAVVDATWSPDVGEVRVRFGGDRSTLLLVAGPAGAPPTSDALRAWFGVPDLGPRAPSAASVVPGSPEWQAAQDADGTACLVLGDRARGAYLRVASPTDTSTGWAVWESPGSPVVARCAWGDDTSLWLGPGLLPRTRELAGGWGSVGVGHGWRSRLSLPQPVPLGAPPPTADVYWRERLWRRTVSSRAEMELALDGGAAAQVVVAPAGGGARVALDALDARDVRVAVADAGAIRVTTLLRTDVAHALAKELAATVLESSDAAAKQGDARGGWRLPRKVPNTGTPAEFRGWRVRASPARCVLSAPRLCIDLLPAVRFVLPGAAGGSIHVGTPQVAVVVTGSWESEQDAATLTAWLRAHGTAVPSLVDSAEVRSPVELLSAAPAPSGPMAGQKRKLDS